jgi:hypothetical protein
LHPILLKKPIDRRAADRQLLKAVLKNNSNMVYVYNCYSDIHKIGYWNTSVLPLIFDKKINGVENTRYIPRECVVTVAGLGIISVICSIIISVMISDIISIIISIIITIIIISIIISIINIISIIILAIIIVIVVLIRNFKAPNLTSQVILVLAAGPEVLIKRLIL